jgi:putative endonuclease
LAEAGMHFVYLIKSLKNGKVYVGSTSKSTRLRLAEHNLGSNKWTRANKPFKLVYYESFFCKQDAVRREKFFKSGVGKILKSLIVRHFISGSSSVG